MWGEGWVSMGRMGGSVRLSCWEVSLSMGGFGLRWVEVIQ